MTLEALRRALAAAGFNLLATLARDVYDPLVPDPWRAIAVAPACRGVVIVANGGRSLWPRFRASEEARAVRDPLDRYTRRVLGEAAATCDPAAAVALYTDRRAETYLPMMALAQRAGLGVPSRLGVLIHPEYGPWLAIRGLLFVPFEVESGEPLDYAPCVGCPAPCATACHGGVVGADGVDVEGCFRTKLLKRACRADCDARRACVVGPEHTYPDEQIEHHHRIRWRPQTVRHALRVLVAR